MKPAFLNQLTSFATITLLAGLLLGVTPAQALEIPGGLGEPISEPEPTPAPAPAPAPAPTQPPTNNPNATIAIPNVGNVPIGDIANVLNASGVQLGGVNTGGATIAIAGQNIPISTIADSFTKAGLDLGTISTSGPTVNIAGQPIPISTIASSLGAAGVNMGSISTGGPTVGIPGVGPIPISSISSALNAAGITDANINTSGAFVNIAGQPIPISTIASSLGAAGVKLGDINTGGPTINIGGQNIPINTISSSLNAAGLNVGTIATGGPTINIGGMPVPISTITSSLTAAGVNLGSINTGGPSITIPGVGPVPISTLTSSLTAAGVNLGAFGNTSGPTLNIGGVPVPVSTLTAGLGLTGAVTNGPNGPEINIPGIGPMPVGTVLGIMSAAQTGIGGAILGGGQPGQDNTFRNYCQNGPIQAGQVVKTAAQVAAINNPFDQGVDGSMSKECVRPKQTDNQSPLAYNLGWLLKEVRDFDKPDGYPTMTKPYVTPAYRNMTNDAFLKGGMGPEGLGGSGLAAGNSGVCQGVAVSCMPNGQVTNREAYNRLLMDGCANQHIMSRALDPGFIFDPTGARAPYNQTFCQPMKMTPVDCIRDKDDKCVQKVSADKKIKKDKFDYEAWEYIARGYRRLLDIPYLPTYWGPLPPKTASAAEEQNDYVDPGTKCKGGAACQFVGGMGDQQWKKLGDGISDVSWGGQDIQINDLVKHQYPRIYDASHPFSPRYDFSGTDRDYSPMTMSYFEFGKCSVNCAAVPVDVMTFRADKFSECMGCRIGVNATCFWSEVAVNAAIFWFIDFGTHFMNTLNNHAIIPVCKTRLAMQGKWPPCNTKFGVNGGADNDPKMCYGCVLLSGTKDKGNGVNKCCSELSKPLAPLNTLTIRSSTDMKEPPEGLKFEDYFGDHKPYMRWWDTGTEAGSLSPNGDPWCNKGRQDAIVGVGTEYNNCRMGGGLGESPIASCFKLPKVDPVTSWAELKLYQARSNNIFGLNCLAQNEKLFKARGAEQLVLNVAGGEPKRLIEGNLQEFGWPLGWRGYVTDPDFADRFPNMGGDASAFMIPGGIDNAQPGDILIWDKENTPLRFPHVSYVVATNTRIGNAGLINPKESEFVQVIDFNGGKYPDSCGNTDMMGMGPERKLYKPDGCLPADDTLQWLVKGPGAVVTSSKGICYKGKQATFPVIEYTLSCNDPALRNCLEDDWAKVKIYRPVKTKTDADVR